MLNKRLMSPMKISLQVILCTDGAANVGLGLLDGRFKKYLFLIREGFVFCWS